MSSNRKTKTSSTPSSSGTELEKVKKYIDILDGREKEVIVGRFGLDLKKEKNSAKSRKNSGFRGAMCPGLRSVR
ncbi:RNA polymerase sigma-K factor [Bacillus licheniformis]|jgi:RNA polymerase sporulation-specific sigma factor|nr:RNA polymerase sigma-K factor [Bacillus licheniformis]TWK67088.1 RNA polymerase sigma-K factor [Bacillus licheniformis]TWM42324.1 RNA polymerase sigma-K factor [Bacillus licheniformis]